MQYSARCHSWTEGRNTVGGCFTLLWWASVLTGYLVDRLVRIILAFNIVDPADVLDLEQIVHHGRDILFPEAYLVDKLAHQEASYRDPTKEAQPVE